MTSPRLVVSVVVHRSPLPVLEKALICLQVAGSKALDAGMVTGLQIVVVDNDSGPRYQQALEGLLHRLGHREVDLTLLRCADNLGYGQGHNQVGSGDDELRLILNPDVFLEPDSLVRGLAFLQCHPGVGLVVPRVVDASGRPEYLCKRYPGVLVLLLRGFAPAWIRDRFTKSLAVYEMRDLDWQRPRFDLELVSGCCLLMRGSIWKSIGGFCPDYFLYFEDFDLAIRAGQQSIIAYVPEFVITHLGGGAARKGWRHRWWFMRSAFRFFNRHGWKWC